MSTYTHRYVEALCDQIDGVRWKYEGLPDPETVVGKVYKISEYNLPEGIHRYYTSVKGVDGRAEWVGKDTNEKKWTLVRWFSDRPHIDNGGNTYDEKYEEMLNRFECSDKFGRNLHLMEGILWCNNGGHIRDDYIGNGWGDCAFKDRGLPPDVSEEVKKDIESDYHYGVTYVLLSEWERMFDSELDKFTAEAKKRFRDEKIDKVIEKLDAILVQNPNGGTPRKKTKRKEEDDDDFMWEDSVDYMFEEEIWKLFNIQNEIDRCEFIVEDLNGLFVGNDCVRIIYYLA